MSGKDQTLPSYRNEWSSSKSVVPNLTTRFTSLSSNLKNRYRNTILIPTTTDH
jgi:hypothetical protein